MFTLTSSFNLRVIKVCFIPNILSLKNFLLKISLRSLQIHMRLQELTERSLSHRPVSPSRNRVYDYIVTPRELTLTQSTDFSYIPLFYMYLHVFAYVGYVCIKFCTILSPVYVKVATTEPP